MVVRIPLELISHNRKICNLYKRWVRNLEASFVQRHEFRYEACLARHRFDKLIEEKDMIKAKQMMEDMEEELYQNLHPSPLYLDNAEIICKKKRVLKKQNCTYNNSCMLITEKYVPDSPNGTAFDRYMDPPDCLIDFWHPLEKSIYPKYFAKRELRKQQYIEMWERQYGSCKNKEETK